MKKLICLIENDPNLTRFLTQRLAWQGFEVVSYPSGEDYLEVHDIGLQALYMIGLNLPGMNGKELVKRIRLTSPLVPIHIISPESDSHKVVETLRSGADDFLIKPIDIDELFARINSAWNKFMLLSSSKTNRSVDTSQ